MTTSIKKEILTIVEETLKELGHVNHGVQGAKPIHTGFSELPISSVSQEHMKLKVDEAYNLIEKALANLDQVVAEMEATGHHPGNLLLITDQVELVANKLAEHLGTGNPNEDSDTVPEELEEVKRRRKKCRCSDGTKRSKCCRKRLRKSSRQYWFGYGWPFRGFYGGIHHHHHHHGDPPPPPPPPETPPADGGDGGGTPPPA